jgi:hypothetical protein
MEPLNLMVSLSHLADDKREHKHGLSQPAGRRGKKTTESAERSLGWWRRLTISHHRRAAA